MAKHCSADIKVGGVSKTYRTAPMTCQPFQASGCAQIIIYRKRALSRVSVTEGDPSQQSQGEYCSRCGTRISSFGSYCPNCGAQRVSPGRETAPQQTPPALPGWTPQPPRVAVRKPPSWRLIIKTILAFGMLTFLAQLFLSLAALVYGTTIVLPEIVHYSYALYVVAPILIVIGELSGEALGAYYLLLVVAILASAAWIFLIGAKGYFKELTMKAESRKHSVVFDLCGLMFGVLFLNYVVILIVNAFWGAPSVPTEGTDLWQLLFVLANASVWEELVVRVLLIGVPLILIDLLRHSTQVKKYRYVLGGGFSFGVAEIVLLLASSVLFGFAHYEGWGAWKVFPSAVAGFAFGYMFLKHGLPSAIMLHFGFDYLTMPTEVFVQGSDIGALVLLGIALIAWAGMGAVFFGYYVTRMIEFVTKKRYFEEMPPAPTMFPNYYTYRYVPPEPQWRPPQPPVQQLPRQDVQVWGPAVSPAPPGPAGFFVCPVCGHTGARWMDGKFQCLRCGAIV